MKDQYHFSKGTRGRVLPPEPEPEPESKARITIRVDQDILDCFLKMAEESGGTTGYQTLINAALREYIEGKAPRFEETLRRIIREELKSSAA
ncbi:BrnA antitoxin family protein [Paludibaculum fermentans]|uniref:BrnA antitoxin family protein n=1 Tax=Paludibaculum fermentans TaxID=1473598 RepID=UPI003EB74350